MQQLHFLCIHHFQIHLGPEALLPPTCDLTKTRLVLIQMTNNSLPFYAMSMKNIVLKSSRTARLV